ncbi:MAG TPA: response regulator [Roseiflexaceae bacterium]|nr:response regulator [Roseiflexaceae bacterium]
MSTTSYHVIVAEDQPTMRGLLVRIVARTYSAVTISAVADGQLALQVFDQAGADLILTNYDMPHLDGIGLAQAIRARGATLPIVMVSADTSAAGAAMAAGVTHFLAKPFQLADLTRVLTTLLPP